MDSCLRTLQISLHDRSTRVRGLMRPVEPSSQDARWWYREHSPVFHRIRTRQRRNERTNLMGWSK